jgi:alanine racemase
MAEKNVATVNLRILRKNAQVVRKKAKTRLCAVVKADAYGHGAAEVASALHGLCDCFAVALAEEALALRYAGVTKPILMLTPPLSVKEAADCIFWDVTLCIDGISAAQKALAGARQAKRRALIQLAVDSGMHRLGVTASEAEEVIGFLEKTKQLLPVGVYSHFADTTDALYCQKQLAVFLSVAQKVKHLFPNVLLHIGATGALNLPFSCSLDMVRVGLGLYGYGTEGVRPVMSLSAPVLRRGYLHYGEHLGYGKAKTGTGNYALCRIGYADGALREGGAFTPRCMDLSYYPAAKIKGNKLPLIGDRTAEELAKTENTVSYEILCRYASRAQKIYLR